MIKTKNDDFLETALRNIKDFNERQHINRIEALRKYEPAIVNALLEASAKGECSCFFQLPYMVDDHFLQEYPSIKIEFEGESTIESPITQFKKINVGYNYKFTIITPE